MSGDNDGSERATSGKQGEIDKIIAQDVKTLHGFGYAQELLRQMSGFSNFAISFSIICILAGGITSYQLGLSSVGGASIGFGWPLSCALSFCMAMGMAQLASAFPTAGGLYHWGSIVGGKGWGWLTAWLNLAGLVTVMAAINVGAYGVITGSVGPLVGFDPSTYSDNGKLVAQIVGVSIITCSQALFNHLGIRLTTKLTDFSGYLIFVVAIALTVALVAYAQDIDVSRLWTFTNYSGDRGGGVWPENTSVTTLFLLGLLLPAYTITGYDASAHTSEETIGAATSVPKGILRAVGYSAVFGWLMLVAILLAIPDMDKGAAQGGNVVFGTMAAVLPGTLKIALFVGISVANYLCGLATVTSASRMAFAFARDGGLPASGALRTISPRFRTPATAIWVVAILSIAFTVYTPVYLTITAVCVVFLYISYVLPVVLGVFAYGKTWKQMGPWSLGGWFRLVGVVSATGVAAIIVVSVIAIDMKARLFLLGSLVTTAVVWFAYERTHFAGPPQGVLIQQKEAEIRAAEKAVGQIR
jgi:amino acid transporter